MDQLIDKFLPDYQFREHHARKVRCRPAQALAAVKTCDLAASAPVRTLFRLRGLPSDGMTLAGMEAVGFRLLGERVARELVIGLVGRFWTPSGGIHRFEPADFSALDGPVWARAATNFHAVAVSSTITRLTTETRVWCPTAASRRRFRLYWWLIRPFSGWVRIEWLRLVSQQAEGARLTYEP